MTGTRYFPVTACEVSTPAAPLVRALPAARIMRIVRALKTLVVAATVALLAAQAAAAKPKPLAVSVSVGNTTTITVGKPDPGYAYPKLRIGVTAATIALLSSTTSDADAHAAVWVNAQDPAGNWLQAGVLSIGGLEPCAYFEVSHAGKRHAECVFAVPFGSPVTVRISVSPIHGWVAWINNVAVASTELGKGTIRSAAVERYLGATVTYTLTPTR